MREEGARGEEGRREVDRDLAIPHVERCVGNRSAHSESAGHVHQRMHALAPVASHAIDERRDVGGICEIARVRARAIASFRELRGARLDFLGGSIDQYERRAEFSKCRGDRFADLACPTHAGEDDSRVRIHSDKHGGDVPMPANRETNSAWHGLCVVGAYPCLDSSASARSSSFSPFSRSP